MATITIAEAQAKLDARARELADESLAISRELRAQTRAVNLDALISKELSSGNVGLLDVRVTTPELGRRIAAYNANVAAWRARRDEINAARLTAANRRANAAEHAAAVAAACPRCFSAHPGEC